MRVDIDWLWISRCVTEGLHHQISREPETGEIFQFITGHRTRGVLRPHCCHQGLAVLTGADTVDTTGLANHLLRQCVALARLLRRSGSGKHIGGPKTQRFARPIS